MELKLYKITSVSKEDILYVFEGHDKYQKVKRRLKKMKDGDMEALASDLADDYINQLYWNSLRTIFEDKYLRG